MASGPFFADIEALLNSHYESGTWRVMLLSGYTPDLDLHNFWDDANANEIANGNGYTTGGEIIVPTVAFNTSTNLFTITFPAYTWTSATISATHAVYRKVVGTPATDPIGYVNDFGGTVTSTNGDFLVNASTYTIDFPDV